MNTLLLLIATQLPLTIHIVEGTTEARLLLNALNRDIRVVDEDTAAIRYYQHELRKIVKVRGGVDTFIFIGKHKTKWEFPSIAYDCDAMVILCLKRECDVFNAAAKKHTLELDFEQAKYAGILDLGDEGVPVDALPQPWQAEYEFTAFKPPLINTE